MLSLGIRAIAFDAGDLCDTAKGNARLISGMEAKVPMFKFYKT